MSTGHFGASGRYDELKEVAQEYAFLVDVLGTQ
jgi:protease II